MRINCHRTGHNRCSRLCVHVTDNQTRYRVPPLRGQNSLRPLKNYDAVSGVLGMGQMAKEEVADGIVFPRPSRHPCRAGNVCGRLCGDRVARWQHDFELGHEPTVTPSAATLSATLRAITPLAAKAGRCRRERH
jgi:hypothetical protein